MNTKGLSLNTIPPILIPVRFFLTAPLFGILAAILIMYYGPDIWLSRWLPGSLALTHLLTLGFMMMVMIGALYQFIPVMVGQYIPGGEVRVFIIHLSLILGTLSLASGFFFHNKVFYWMAFVFLCLSLSLFALSLISLIMQKFQGQLIIFIIRILSFVLIMTIGFGLLMLLAYSYPDSGIAYRIYTDTHALWGLVGWVVLLIMAVSSQVIPMFFVTPEFSVRYLKILSVLMLVTLMMISFSSIYISHFPNLVREILYVLVSIELVFFSTYTLRLIYYRKRKIPDTTIKFFSISLFSLLFVLVVWWAIHIWPNAQLAAYEIESEFVLGLFLIYGLALSAIIGMLQKIVPFLIYLNLQSLSFKHPESMSHKPKLVLNMKQVITMKQSKIQFFLHVSSLILLNLSIFWNQLVVFAGFAVLLNFIWLTMVLYKGFYLFSHNKTAILQFPEMKIDFNV